MGGFLDPRINHKDLVDNFGKDGENPVVRAGETAEQCAIREAMEEFNIVVEEHELHLFHVGSSDLHDPRAHVVNICFYVELDNARWNAALPGDDIADLADFKIDQFLERPARMAFNHADLVVKGVTAWRKETLFKKMMENLETDEYMRLVYE
jgi:ADP-ribose pyrophosphatase YjhB (NUDIX family)